MIVRKVPQGDSADKTLIHIFEQNKKALQDCLLGASHWLRKNNLPGRRSGLRIKIGDTEKANDLITNRVFLTYTHHSVNRY